MEITIEIPYWIASWIYHFRDNIFMYTILLSYVLGAWFIRYNQAKDLLGRSGTGLMWLLSPVWVTFCAITTILRLGRKN